MIPLSWYLYLAAALFSLGLYGVLVRKNPIAILMSVELMLNAVNINIVAFWRYLASESIGGQIFAVIVFAVAAAEVAGGAQAGLSSGSLQVKYTVPDANNPALDFVAALFNPGNTTHQVKFHSDGTGPLRSGFGAPDGNPGTCVIVQNGLYNTSGGGATADEFPVEHVTVKRAP